MLGKLIKNEFKSTAHATAWIYFAGIVSIAVMWISILLRIKVMMGISYVTLGIVAFIVSGVTLLTTIILLYRSLYGEQGYLSFTLPVTGGQLLASKFIVSVIWILISYALTIASIVSIVAYVIAREVNENARQMIESFYDILREFGKAPEKSVIIAGIVSCVVLVFMWAISIVIRFALASALGNSKFGGNTGIGLTIVFYVVEFIVLLVLYGIGALIQIYCTFGDGAPTIIIGAANIPPLCLPIPIFVPIFMLAYHIVLYILASKVISNRVNVR